MLIPQLVTLCSAVRLDPDIRPHSSPAASCHTTRYRLCQFTPPAPPNIMNVQLS
jgi:hypothetical protein